MGATKSKVLEAAYNFTSDTSPIVSHRPDIKVKDYYPLTEDSDLFSLIENHFP
jgi:hypothetical protein